MELQYKINWLYLTENLRQFSTINVKNVYNTRIYDEILSQSYIYLDWIQTNEIY